MTPTKIIVFGSKLKVVRGYHLTIKLQEDQSKMIGGGSKVLKNFLNSLEISLDINVVWLHNLYI